MAKENPRDRVVPAVYQRRRGALFLCVQGLDSGSFAVRFSAVGIGIALPRGGYLSIREQEDGLASGKEDGKATVNHVVTFLLVLPKGPCSECCLYSEELNTFRSIGVVPIILLLMHI